MTTFIELSQNIALILSLTFIYGLISPRLERISRQVQETLRGLFFGAFAIISMMMPIQVEPGMFYDARTIVVCVAGIYGGAIPALIAATLVGLVRILIGGVGTTTGLANVATAALIGIALHAYYKRRGTKPHPFALLAAGLAIVVAGTTYIVLLSGITVNITGTRFLTTTILYPVGMLLLGALITYQQRSQETERALRAGERRFRAIFNSAFEFMGLLKPDGTVIEVNQTVLDLRDLKSGSFVDIPLWETPWGKSSPEREAQLIDAISRAARGEIVRLELTLEVENHQELVLDFSLKPLRDEAGQITLLVAEARDISAHKELELQKVDLVLERERSRLLKKFISDVSHDLRTPLAVIRLNLELLRRTLDTPQQHQRVDTLASQEQHLTRLLTDMMTMLTLDEQSNFQFKPLDLNYLAQLVVEGQHAAAQHKQQTLTFNHSDDALLIQADQVELERALNKLLVNALGYTPKGGTITLSTLKEADSAVIEIRDTGIGISPDDLPNIFQRFYRADRARSMDTGGTGLGLSIAKRVVEAHNGHIEVESAPDAGSTFRVLLPLVPESQSTAADPLYH